MPPYLAGRKSEFADFFKLLQQDVILDNMILTGLRGVGKTVLLEAFKSIAINNNWLWIGNDLSEATSMSEENIAIRLLTDLSVITSNIIIQKKQLSKIGFIKEESHNDIFLNYDILRNIFSSTPGLTSDKLKHTIHVVWESIKSLNKHGVVFAYDEAQNLSDKKEKEQYPLALLLDVFQSIQRAGIPFLLILTGLPTLAPKLVESRTFAERMFKVVFLDKLNADDSRDAIIKPIQNDKCPISLTEKSVNDIIEISKGYPYFIQFICRETYDSLLQNSNVQKSVPVKEILRKLDSDFFSGRWAKITDRQKELLTIIAQLNNASNEFTIQEIVDLSKKIAKKSFSNSHINQMLISLFNAGLIYKNRYSKYSFAVPLMNEFILRQIESLNTPPLLQ
ncbi:MAG: ATP-binding protein [Desulfamplus sp.]|nr:ATP-binding protein [Desulfamplus sp.]